MLHCKIYNNSLFHILLLWGVALFTLFAAAGCDVHEWPEDGDAPAKVRCYVRLRYHTGSMPLYSTVEYDRDGTMATSRSDAAPQLRYLLNIYESGSSRNSRVPSDYVTGVITLDGSEGDEFERIVSLSLPVGNYEIIAWSDYVEDISAGDLFYATPDMSAISIIPDESGRHPGNTELRQAWRGMTGVSITEADMMAAARGDGRIIMAEADMVRPMARFRFVTTDVEEFLSRGPESSRGGESIEQGMPLSLDDYRIVVRYATYMPSVYNAFVDKPVDSRTGQSFDASIKRLDDQRAEVGFDYVFVNGSEARVELALDVYSNHTRTLISSTPTVSVPLVRGKLTEITGKFLTGTATGGMGIDPGFNGDYNIEIK